ncbi:peptidoglycan editing factor PgeF [Thermanaerothrix sp. 4228-RoL]|jgi:YfiH family protein|uniref:Purine nucleoside phosphorylase n=1 Tax=Thermanaerothrix solaris TaxID=3058434 RepID=A0ABU3NJ66_9CHLR|nr:peptidoglycan editing factor PgeF [Thermanaerothrix sp. 4228-RoL]MDT8896847.1 peptidoglycan editing factor PgeF [Thermanaerothrix sp. 4228-RoL]
MGFVRQNGLVYYQFDIFPPAVVHGVFTRLGGVSPVPWASLNLGGNLGDTRENIIENRRRIFEVVNRKVETIFDVWQVHSDIVVCTDQPRPLDTPHSRADAILTQNPNVTLFMRFADCVPIFLYDPENNVVGLVHAGWKGTLAAVTYKAIEVMRTKYGSVPSNILAAIGPSIGPDHYVVGPEVIEGVKQTFQEDSEALLIQRNGRTYFDLWQANTLWLSKAGVAQVEIAGLCTACDTHHWYSHRGEAGRTGRFGALIALNS